VLCACAALQSLQRDADDAGHGPLHQRALRALLRAGLPPPDELAAVHPYARLKCGVRVAMRRRKGYAALRRVRLAVRAALALHRQRSEDAARAYNAGAELAKIDAYYKRTIKRVRARWPALSLFDPRADV
jgi:hypothetical protein